MYTNKYKNRGHTHFALSSVLLFCSDCSFIIVIQLFYFLLHTLSCFLFRRNAEIRAVRAVKGGIIREAALCVKLSRLSAFGNHMVCKENPFIPHVLHYPDTKLGLEKVHYIRLGEKERTAYIFYAMN
jgi:hypothetical protein